MITGAVANNGIMLQPQLLGGVDAQQQIRPKQYGRVLTQTQAEQLTQWMQVCVETGTGTKAAVSGVTVAGKTGTAEVGGTQKPHAWFTGFVCDPEYPVCVTVIVEHGGGGGSVAAPVAARVMETAIQQMR